MKIIYRSSFLPQLTFCVITGKGKTNQKLQNYFWCIGQLYICLSITISTNLKMAGIKGSNFYFPSKNSIEDFVMKRERDSIQFFCLLIFLCLATDKQLIFLKQNSIKYWVHKNKSGLKWGLELKVFATPPIIYLYNSSRYGVFERSPMAAIEGFPLIIFLATYQRERKKSIEKNKKINTFFCLIILYNEDFKDFNSF